jgi:hypothetical protein
MTKAENDMEACHFDNFGDLYRAALAENDPELKQKLLAHVKNALDLWAEADRKRSNAPPLASQPPLRVNRTSVHRVA